MLDIFEGGSLLDWVLGTDVAVDESLRLPAVCQGDPRSLVALDGAAVDLLFVCVFDLRFAVGLDDDGELGERDLLIVGGMHGAAFEVERHQGALVLQSKRHLALLGGHRRGQTQGVVRILFVVDIRASGP